MKQSARRSIAIILLALSAAACSRHDDKQADAQTVSPPAKAEVTGEDLFNERCRDCHTVHQKGGAVGPDLSKVGSLRSPDYLEQVIREPSKTFPGTSMPPYDTFSTKQIKSLVEYLGTLK